jgi:hypothetical protein
MTTFKLLAGGVWIGSWFGQTVKTVLASANLNGVNFHLLVLYIFNYNSVAHIIGRYYLLKKKRICVT